MRQITINGITFSLPHDAIAYCHADRTNDACWIYDAAGIAFAESIDPSLIVYPDPAEEICRNL